MNTSFSQKKLGFVILLGIVLFITISLCIYNINFNNIHSEDSSLEFSEVSWSEDPSKRIYMYENLIRKYDFYDMSKDDVLQLLGNMYCSISENGNITYYMGEKTNSWFSYNLRICFDEYNMVKEFELYQD